MIISYSDRDVIKGKNSIFLAGPTPRKKEIKSWRFEAIDYLQKLEFNGVVYVPEDENGGMSKNQKDQSNWEKEALVETKIIVFWIPRRLPDMPGFTTNVEFGLWIKSGKVLYGRPEWAQKIGYLDWLYKEECKKDPFNNLIDLLTQAVKLSETILSV